MSAPPVLVLAGPTGVGKTDWAAALAQVAPVEIVSVDSALVYRGMDIGTAKPDAALRQRVPHHLIDICDPAESYSAGRFVREALGAIRDIHARGRVPLLVGGTMLYLRALRRGLAELPQASAELRAHLDARAASEGWPALHAELTRVDPAAAARIAPRDRQRIQRALEVWYATGTPLSVLQRASAAPLAAFTVHGWVLAPQERVRLHERIAQRFGHMMERGFLQEVQALRARGDLTASHPALRAVGYRQLWAHLEGAWGLAEAVQRGIHATRQLAKRQLTWLRAESPGPTHEPGDPGPWIEEVRRTLGRFGR